MNTYSPWAYHGAMSSLRGRHRAIGDHPRLSADGGAAQIIALAAACGLVFALAAGCSRPRPDVPRRSAAIGPCSRHHLDRATASVQVIVGREGATVDGRGERIEIGLARGSAARSSCWLRPRAARTAIALHSGPLRRARYQLMIRVFQRDGPPLRAEAQVLVDESVAAFEASVLLGRYEGTAQLAIVALGIQRRVVDRGAISLRLVGRADELAYGPFSLRNSGARDADCVPSCFPKSSSGACSRRPGMPQPISGCEIELWQRSGRRWRPLGSFVATSSHRVDPGARRGSKSGALLPRRGGAVLLEIHWQRPAPLRGRRQPLPAGRYQARIKYLLDQKNRERAVAGKGALTVSSQDYGYARAEFTVPTTR